MKCQLSREVRKTKAHGSSTKETSSKVGSNCIKEEAKKEKTLSFIKKCSTRRKEHQFPKREREDEDIEVGVWGKAI